MSDAKDIGMSFGNAVTNVTNLFVAELLVFETDDFAQEIVDNAELLVRAGLAKQAELIEEFGDPTPQRSSGSGKRGSSGRSSGGARRGSSGGGGGGGNRANLKPTQKQIDILLDNDWSEEDATGLTRGEASEEIDKIFNG